MSYIRRVLANIRARRAAILVAAATLMSCGGPANRNEPTPRVPERAPSPARGPVVARPAAFAGTWYPADPAALAKTVDATLDAPRAKILGGPVRALIVPHAGMAFSGEVAGAAFRQVKGARYERVIVLGPAHDVAFSGAGLERATHYRTPLGDVPLDTSAIAALRAKEGFSEQDAAGAKEHSIEMEIPFLQRALAPGFSLVPVLVGDVDPSSAQAIADGLRPFATERTLVVASGDFTHYGQGYGYLPFPLDKTTPKRLEGLDLGFFHAVADLEPAEIVAYRDKTHIDSCGEGPFLVLSSLLAADARDTLVRYRQSGSKDGDYSTSVSYVGAVFSGPTAPADAGRELPRSDMRALLSIARRALDAGVKSNGKIDLAAVLGSLSSTPRLDEKRGAFVTLEEHGELRGCIGTLSPSAPLAATVAEDAVLAALHDDRFPPVRPEELSSIDVEVSVLSPEHKIPSFEAIRLGADGVVMERDGRRAVFLPEVATEQGWDTTTLLEELGLKAGLSRGAYREGAVFETFTSEVIPWDVR